MATGGGQEDTGVSQVEFRNQEIIEEVALTGVLSKALPESDATPVSYYITITLPKMCLWGH